MSFTANTRLRATRSKARVTHFPKALARANRAANKAHKVLSPPRDMQLSILQRILEVSWDRRKNALETTGKTG
jgi:hypothetical protein